MEQSGVSSDDVGERTNNGMERISAFWRMERNRVCEDEREIKEMGLPNINIAFKSTAASAIERSEKGVVALIIKDAKENGGHAYTNASQIPATLGTDNQAYIQRAFTGYVNPPRQVLVYVLPAAAEALTDALTWLATQTFDYLAGPPDCTEAEATAGGATTRPSARRCCRPRRRTARRWSTSPPGISWWGRPSSPRRNTVPGSRGSSPGRP